MAKFRPPLYYWMDFTLGFHSSARAFLPILVELSFRAQLESLGLCYALRAVGVLSGLFSSTERPAGQPANGKTWNDSYLTLFYSLMRLLTFSFVTLLVDFYGYYTTDPSGGLCGHSGLTDPFLKRLHHSPDCREEVKKKERVREFSLPGILN